MGDLEIDILKCLNQFGRKVNSNELIEKLGPDISEDRVYQCIELLWCCKPQLILRHKNKRSHIPEYDLLEITTEGKERLESL